ncbi:hypothetical protein MKOR_26940 [Mycolicibacillus koreensis]|nr:hypothetical protein MKOR_26940 [Mycolicibacillus koreensis]
MNTNGIHNRLNSLVTPTRPNVCVTDSLRRNAHKLCCAKHRGRYPTVGADVKSASASVSGDTARGAGAWGGV